MSMSQADGAHCTVEHTQALGLSCCGLILLGMMSVPPGELRPECFEAQCSLVCLTLGFTDQYVNSLKLDTCELDWICLKFY